jgi:hypothetical protein
MKHTSLPSTGVRAFPERVIGFEPTTFSLGSKPKFNYQENVVSLHLERGGQWFRKALTRLDLQAPLPKGVLRDIL